ncbi:MAG: DNA topoisomerase IB [Gemmatimonadota bacterium]
MITSPNLVGTVREFLASLAKTESWWQRAGTPKRPRYLGSNGRPLASASTLKRIHALRIPPAWTDVHISPDPKRKVQAFGYDAAGRKQYIYSSAHVARRDSRKWKKLLHVSSALPLIRDATNRHLRRRRLDREKVHATVVRLVCRAYFRAGSERYAVQHRTFGISTLRKHHVQIDRNNLIFCYRGKRKIDQRQFVADTPLVEIIEELLSLPGARLFQYMDAAGRIKPVTAQSVNRYLEEVAGCKLTSKDLRTLGGTVRAATILSDIGPARTNSETKRNLTLTCKLVSLDLGNTPTIARKAYIHPAVLDEYARAGRTTSNMRKHPRRLNAIEPIEYYPEEAALIRFLERYG